MKLRLFTPTSVSQLQTDISKQLSNGFLSNAHVSHRMKPVDSVGPLTFPAVLPCNYYIRVSPGLEQAFRQAAVYVC